ncbi:hypothetical protein [Plantibacter sp. M259]|uniref:hypothetical protein n=1 Tax=Plantibacter sp. M259 TaxID=2583822 RepID=UPI001F0DF476|nr:hypothetical protein [Plantibacter sp. M259]
MTRVPLETRVIRTVLGDIDPATAGVVDSHDHLFLRTPVLAGEDLVDEPDATTAVERFAAAGGRTVVQWTPRGLGRGLPALRRISASTGSTSWRRPDVICDASTPTVLWNPRARPTSSQRRSSTTSTGTGAD